MLKISIIIPVYNEEKTIRTVISRVKNAPLPDNIRMEIIIIDDGSEDGTKDILRTLHNEENLLIYEHLENKGKTAAIRKGLTKASGDIILIQDADLEYHPDNYPALLRPILTGQAAIVYGSRFKGTIKNMSLSCLLANKLANLTFNLLYKTKLTDINTGFKAFKNPLVKQLSLTSKNFCFETEVTAKLVRKGYGILEVPIQYRARSKAEGKKMNLSKALEMYWEMFKHGGARS